MAVGGEAARRMIDTPGRLNDGSAVGYGMGVYVGSRNGRLMIGHAGSDPGFKADYIRFPDERLAVSVLCNSFEAAPTPIAQAIADLLLPPPAAPDRSSQRRPADAAVALPADAASLAGRYWNPDVAQAVTVLFEGGRLLLDGGGEGKFELRHIGGNRFLLPVAPRRFVLAFSRAPDGTQRVRREIAGERSRDFVAVPGAEGSVRLSAYAGTYYSAELDIEWTVVERGGALRIFWRRFSEEELTPLLPGIFQFSGGFFTVAFAPPAGEGSPWFEVTTERARHMRFERVPPRG